MKIFEEGKIYKSIDQHMPFNTNSCSILHQQRISIMRHKNTRWKSRKWNTI